ncbi:MULTISPECIES: TRAP transporter large permease [unclassified Brevibacterium]|uniref:TRAP transporter large permease n=1 Tax=unclassified Brevibacterium TaxID=2614124 RepID=UPI000C6297A1|nr:MULTISPECIES: TRAP transporter large permease [unclassified Brevibacterium]SMX86938.1 TRAP transporter, DctM subunit [Brevibacterium sp. 239c]
MIAITISVVLLILILIKVPIPFAILGAAGIGLLWVGGSENLIGVFEVIPMSSVGSNSLAAIPLFILMAHLVLKSGVLDTLFNSASTLIGRIRGGTGIAAVLAGAGFAAVSGSSTAAAATLAHTSTGTMLKQGYSPRLASGTVASAGTLAAMIPPSILLVFYAITAETSVGKTLLAGVIPGILMSLGLAITVWVMGLRGHAPATERTPWMAKLTALKGLLPIAFLFAVVVGTVFLGIATATEAAALGCLGGLFLMVSMKTMTWSNLKSAVVGSVSSSAMILSIVFAAHVFGIFLTQTQVAPTVVEYVQGLAIAPTLVIVIFALIYLVLGFFMDQMAIIALTVPVTLPVVEALGFDPIWFGVIVILLAEIGLITPPLGLNAFVVSRAAGIRVETVFMGSVPFIIAMLIVTTLIFVFPDLSLFLTTSVN